MVKLTEEHDLETLRQISLLLDRENQRLITKNLELTAELARLRGVPDVEQLAFTVQHQLQQVRTAILQLRQEHVVGAVGAARHRLLFGVRRL